MNLQFLGLGYKPLRFGIPNPGEYYLDSGYMPLCIAGLTDPLPAEPRLILHRDLLTIADVLDQYLTHAISDQDFENWSLNYLAHSTRSRNPADLTLARRIRTLLTKPLNSNQVNLQHDLTLLREELKKESNPA